MNENTPGFGRAPDAIRLVPLGPEHAEALTELFERTRGTDAEKSFRPFPLTAETVRELIAHDGKDFCLVALDGEELVGLLTARGLDEGHEAPGVGLLVDERRRGQGVGRAMLREATKVAHAMNLTGAYATVDADNAASAKLMSDYAGADRVEERVEVVDGKETPRFSVRSPIRAAEDPQPEGS